MTIKQGEWYTLCDGDVEYMVHTNGLFVNFKCATLNGYPVELTKKQFIAMLDTLVEVAAEMADFDPPPPRTPRA